MNFISQERTVAMFLCPIYVIDKCPELVYYLDRSLTADNLKA